MHFREILLIPAGLFYTVLIIQQQFLVDTRFYYLFQFLEFSRQVLKTKDRTQVYRCSMTLYHYLTYRLMNFSCLRLIWKKAPEDDSWKNDLITCPIRIWLSWKALLTESSNQRKWRTSNPPPCIFNKISR